MNNKNLDFLMQLGPKDIFDVNLSYEKDHDINEEYIAIEIELSNKKKIYIEHVFIYRDKSSRFYLHTNKYNPIFREYELELSEDIYSHITSCAYEFKDNKGSKEMIKQMDTLNNIKSRKIEMLKEFFNA